jgi:spore maturation protein CgeB
VVIRYLRERGVPVTLFGGGWGKMGQFAECPADVFSRSQINFGIGGISFSEIITNVKGRDFDIPCTGGGVYLTTYNPDLAKVFDIGREVLCYRTRDEAVEMAMHYLARPDECREIALRARERCLREHRWSHRFSRLCEILGLLQDSDRSSDV